MHESHAQCERVGSYALGVLPPIEKVTCFIKKSTIPFF